ncbi:MAG: ribosome silencing factor [Marinilabiliaceae bacterium]|jgi:ribosome-associated protein|nr:ribosome silencing factor [Marinilabiliaceae bacterium]
MNENSDETAQLLDAVAEGIFEKQGDNVVLMDMRQLNNPVCDYFVICHAQSTTQVDAIAESVMRKVKAETREKPLHKEGLDNCFWVLLDYSNLIVHIFVEEYRKLYNLEGLWADAETENLVDKKMK